MAGEVLTIRDQVALRMQLGNDEEENWRTSIKEELAGYPEPDGGIEYLKWDAAWKAALMFLRADAFLEKRNATTT